MSNAVATIQPKSVLIDMATRYGMEPAAFEATVRATCMKPDRDGRVPSREEFAAFLLVAKEYNLNPLTKEIYAFAAKGGGIVPIVSIDGWVNLVNSSGACDGFEFDMDHDDKGNLVSCTCRMYRKDRSRPVSVTEYLSECIRPTDPWKMKHRMLRHKALVQASRYAFGFSGVYDEDEGAKIAAAKDRDIQDVEVIDDGGGPPVPPSAQIAKPEAPAAAQVEHKAEVPAMFGGATEDAEFEEVEEKKRDPISTGPSGFPGDTAMPDIPANLRRVQPKPVLTDDERDWLEGLKGSFSGCEDMEALLLEVDRLMKPAKEKVSTAAYKLASDLMDVEIERINGDVS